MANRHCSTRASKRHMVRIDGSTEFILNDKSTDVFLIVGSDATGLIQADKMGTGQIGLFWDCVTHNGTGLCDEEEFSEGSVKRQQHSDTGGVLAQAVFHGHEELPQGPQQRQLTGSGEAEQQVNGFEALVPSLAAGHAHLPLPDVSQRQVTEHWLIGQHLLQYLKT
ncbi:hypothetical protein EYF80_025045 [Liparis tanakae]|uniref:Uncharacterized protein n=1 Tax=Liparis tanakae TaxID=230148 RepID=A0A4Z2HFW0_9TELE|nr:hypothetical protein EYF80_025045 [Liparis tanakae]